MTPERWRQIENLYQLARNPQQSAAMLAAARFSKDGQLWIRPSARSSPAKPIHMSVYSLAFIPNALTTLSTAVGRTIICPTGTKVALNPHSQRPPRQRLRSCRQTVEMPRPSKTPDPPASGADVNAGAYVRVTDPSKPLWHLPLNATIKTSPMTYTVDGEQFVALAVGSNITSCASR